MPQNCMRRTLKLFLTGFAVVQWYGAVCHGVSNTLPYGQIFNSALKCSVKFEEDPFARVSLVPQHT